MKLTSKQLKEVYEAYVIPFGHPDALGFMARMLLISEGDTNYLDPLSDRQGLMGVDPVRSKELTGISNVAGTESNILAALTMDRLYFEQFARISDMIIASEFGQESVLDSYSGKELAFLKEINGSRELLEQLMYPPSATIDDVIKALNELNISATIPARHMDFYDKLLTRSF